MVILSSHLILDRVGKCYNLYWVFIAVYSAIGESFYLFLVSSPGEEVSNICTIVTKYKEKDDN